MLQAFVVTRGRVCAQQTLKSLGCSPAWCARVDLKIVIPRCERELWEKKQPQWVPFLYVVDDDWRVEQIRQHVLQTFSSRKYHVVLDDDLTIKRKTAMRSLETMLDSLAFFRHIEKLLECYSHGSIASHVTHQYKNPGLCVNERAGGVHFYDRGILLREKIDFTTCYEHEDLHCSLSLIKKGYPNIISYYFAFVQKTNKTGGCSRYRSLETQNKFAERLVKCHRPFARLSKRKFSKLWNGMKVGVTIYWKKAYAMSTRTGIPQVDPDLERNIAEMFPASCVAETTSFSGSAGAIRSELPDLTSPRVKTAESPQASKSRGLGSADESDSDDIDESKYDIFKGSPTEPDQSHFIISNIRKEHIWLGAQVVITWGERGWEGYIKGIQYDETSVPLKILVYYPDNDNDDTQAEHDLQEFLDDVKQIEERDTSDAYNSGDQVSNLCPAKKQKIRMTGSIIRKSCVYGTNLYDAYNPEDEVSSLCPAKKQKIRMTGSIPSLAK